MLLVTNESRAGMGALGLENNRKAPTRGLRPKAAVHYGYIMVSVEVSGIILLQGRCLGCRLLLFAFVYGVRSNCRYEHIIRGVRELFTVSGYVFSKYIQYSCTCV
jgi:hypothetical protein